MVAIKQKTGGQTSMLATVAVSIAVIFSSISFYSISFGDCEEATMYGAQANALFGSSVSVTPSMSARESFGWFDDIPEEGWRLMKLRAQTAVQYMNPWKPQTGYENPILWYLDNLQVSRLFSC
jgi:hypothetical protein